MSHNRPFGASDARLEQIGAYLKRAFPDWEMTVDWDPRRDAHVFRLARHPQPIHLLTVRRALVEGKAPAELARLLDERDIATQLRTAPANRVVMNPTYNGNNQALA